MNVSSKASLSSDDKMVKILEKIIKEIHSPLMGVSIFLKSCEGLSINNRAFLENAIGSIVNITGDLIHQFSAIALSDMNENQYMVLPFGLIDLIQKKKNKFDENNIKINISNNLKGRFAFIKTDARELISVLSEFLEYSINVFNDEGGKIDIILMNDNNTLVKIIAKSKIVNTDIYEKSLALSNLILKAENLGAKINLSSDDESVFSAILAFKNSFSHNNLLDDVKIKKDAIILILDDDLSTFSLLSSCLETCIKGGVELRYFRGGMGLSEFLSSIENIEDLIVMADYHMNDKDGFIKILKKYDIIKQSILITNYMSENDIAQSKSLNFNKILVKSHLPYMRFRIA